MIRTRLVAVLLLAACATAPSSDATVFGEWKEHWGTPGQTDVTYHDRYSVTLLYGGEVKVEVLDREQEIADERLDGEVLTFTQQTTFAIQYSLTLEPDGRWMVGTATTPEEIVDVRWERTE